MLGTARLRVYNMWLNRYEGLDDHILDTLLGRIKVKTHFFKLGFQLEKVPLAAIGSLSSCCTGRSITSMGLLVQVPHISFYISFINRIVCQMNKSLLQTVHIG